MVINQTIGSFLKKHKLLVFFVVIIIFIIWMSYFYIGIKTSHKKNTNIIGVRFDDVVKQLEINTMHLASYRSLYSALSLNVPLPAEQILNQWKMHNEYVYTMVLLDQKKGFFSMSKIQETKAVNDSLYFQDLEWRALEYKNPTKIGDLSYTQYEVNEKKIVLFQREIKNNELVFGYLVAILDISKVFKNLKAQQHISKDIQFNISDSFHNKQCYLGSSILLKGYVCSEINLKYIITYIKDELLFVALTLFAGVLLGVFFVYIRSNKIRVATIYSLSSQVAHDIRSPLTALSIATSELKEVPEEKRLLIRSAVQRIEDIANDLSSKKAESLKVKSERTEEKETSIQLMSSIIERIVSEKRIQFRNKQEINIASKSNTESYGLFTKINTKEFKRVISNIINNAIEATDNNGAVKIKTTLEENNINIIVKDNGKGIPANVLPKLMNQGATFGKEKGQGLGLYHAKETIQSWGGNIKIESEIGKGTTVTLSLPKQPAPNWFLPELVVRENLIIILDDDESIHQVWNNRLKAAGIPKEAIKHFKDPYKLIFWYKSRDSLSIEDPEQSRRTNPIDAEELTSCHSLEDLQNLMGNCGRCPLHKGRKNIVFGVGNPNADLMFVGEGPGADEDEQGIPFVGKAGRLLTRMIEAMGYKRDDVYIANVVKCRPPGNRNPEPNEIEACMPFLKTQIKTINPKAIVCLGKFAAQTLLETQTAISRIRGTFQDVDNYAVMPTFHPAYLLRNAGMKKLVWEDLKKVMAKLKET